MVVVRRQRQRDRVLICFPVRLRNGPTQELGTKADNWGSTCGYRKRSDTNESSDLELYPRDTTEDTTPRSQLIF